MPRPRIWKSRYSLIAFLSFFLFFLVLIPSLALAAERFFGLVDTAQNLWGDSLGDQYGIRLMWMLGLAMKAVLSLLGSIFFLIIVHAGFLWMTARGNKEQVQKAKDKMIHASIALIVILSSYALSSYVVDKTLEATVPAPPPADGGGE